MTKILSTLRLLVQDQAIPQLLTAAFEAYEFKHQGRSSGPLETFGLLWGYVLPNRAPNPSQIVVINATVETSAVRHSDWIISNFQSVRAKLLFFQRHWPEIELVGTFHSHPYSSLSEVNGL